MQAPSEYAVWGWAKWTEPEKRGNQHTLFRLTSDLPGEINDDSEVGDRVLNVIIERGLISFSTYTFHFSGTQIEPNYEQSVDTGDESVLTEWFFVYFGVSLDLNEAYAYIRFQNNGYGLLWENVYHMKSNQLTL